MKPANSSKIKLLNEALPYWVLAFAIEELTRADIAGLESELTKQEFLNLFTQKYKRAIEISDRVFIRIVNTSINSAPTDFFSVENIANISTRSSETPLRESIFKRRDNLVDLIFENTVRYAAGGLGDPNKMTTSQVNFSWGKYKIPDPEDPNFKNQLKIAAADYFILDGESKLGEKQFPGDPFTYRETSSGDLMVISGPGSINPATGNSYKNSIGRSFSTPQASEVEKVPEEKRREMDQRAKEDTDRKRNILDSKRASEIKQKNKEYAFASYDSGIIPMLAWVSIADNMGIEEASRQINQNIPTVLYRENLIKRSPEICKTRMAMVMILLAKKIEGMLEKSIRAFVSESDPIIFKNAVFEGEGRLKIEPFASYVEKIGLSLSKKILDRWVEESNFEKFSEDDADNPSGWFSAMFSDRDKCGYLLDMAGTESDPYGRPDVDVTEDQKQRPDPGFPEDYQKYLDSLRSLCDKRGNPNNTEQEELEALRACMEIEENKWDSELEGRPPDFETVEDAMRATGRVQ